MVWYFCREDNSMEEKYSLNEQTLLFIQDFEKGVESGKVHSTHPIGGYVRSIYL
jgi:hypothetical protein